MLHRSLSLESFPLIMPPEDLVKELLNVTPSSYHLGEFKDNPRDIRLIPREELYVITADVTLSRLRLQLDSIEIRREELLDKIPLTTKINKVRRNNIVDQTNKELSTQIDLYAKCVTGELLHECEMANESRGVLAYVDSVEDATVIYEYFRTRDMFVAIAICSTEDLLDNYGNYPYDMAFKKYAFEPM